MGLVNERRRQALYMEHAQTVLDGPHRFFACCCGNALVPFLSEGKRC